MTQIYRKLTEAGVDKKDVEILWELAKERSFSEQELEEIGQNVGLNSEEVKKRIESLRSKNILLKDRVSILDQVKIWDSYYIVLIKAAIQPPVIGIDTKFPTGWAVKDYLSGLKEVQQEMGIDLIRHAYTLQGTEWDILLVISAQSQKEYVEFVNKVAKQGWISKVWSMIPGEYGDEWIFDPINTPDPKHILEEQTNLLKSRDE